MPFRVQGLDHVALGVGDQKASESWYRDVLSLRGRGIAFEFQDHGVSHSIYFQDPDGLQLELTTYEV